MVHVTCLCPLTAAGETRHPDGDTIGLRERLPFREALTARNAIVLAKAEDELISEAEISAVLTETFLLVGVESWSLVDQRGKAIPVSRQAIRDHLLSVPDVAMEVGEVADGLYAVAVVAPLVARARPSSLPSQTNGSTSATNGRSPAARKRPRPSSTSTIPTAATGTT